ELDDPSQRVGGGLPAREALVVGWSTDDPQLTRLAACPPLLQPPHEHFAPAASEPRQEPEGALPGRFWLCPVFRTELFTQVSQQRQQLSIVLSTPRAAEHGLQDDVRRILSGRPRFVEPALGSIQVTAAQVQLGEPGGALAVARLEAPSREEVLDGRVLHPGERQRDATQPLHRRAPRAQLVRPREQRIGARDLATPKVQLR